jgi:hypothetical protein
VAIPILKEQISEMSSLQTAALEKAATVATDWLLKA